MRKGMVARQVFYSLEHAAMSGLLEELQQAAAGADPVEEEKLALLMLRLVLFIEEQAKDAIVPGLSSASRTVTHIERITEWLDEHYKEPFRLERLAEHLHLSPYHISRIYKDGAGMTLTEYLVRRRVREACRLLADTGFTVKEIAAEPGGLSPSYFSQMFRKAKGMTPGQYKSSIR
ncbi:helix-turn-helix transcriptional regulator [Paenibacillus tengchongensis]|uniref:helix-turn-helix transcriptional regulator n=1 Tax=Paenibacillus tengchongensis TaxID=2608684 RepID=UPI00124EF5BF|nr:AraC family transcriptional regulator [Paenibacillus tengchongensis]